MSDDTPVLEEAKPPTGMVIPDKVYNVLKPVVQVILPGAATLYAGLAALYGWDNSERVVGTCVLVATFLGLFLTLSSRAYNSSDARFDGVVTVVPDHENDLTDVGFRVNPDALVPGKKELILKVNDLS